MIFNNYKLFCFLILTVTVPGKNVCHILQGYNTLCPLKVTFIIFISTQDRPARAIYQPKVRKCAAPEENEQNAPTNSTCATETNGGSESNVPLIDEKAKNKRLGRRNKQKPQDNAVNIRVSKSSESSTSAHSTITK